MAEEQKRIVVVGGGFGGLFTALGLDGAGEITIISREDHFLFTPLLYEYLSGEVEAWHIAPYYRDLLDDRVRFVRGEVTAIDFDAREVTIADRVRRVGYDALILATGGVSNFAGVEGAEQHAFQFRKIAHADALRFRMIETLDRISPTATPEAARDAATFVVVGGGASGVELATKMADLLRDAFERRGLPGEPRVMIVEMLDQIVPGMEHELRQYVLDGLRESHVEAHTKTKVRRVTNESLVYEQDGAEHEVHAAAVVWTGGVRMPPLVESLPLEKDKRGLIVVEPTLQARGHEDVFVLGDAASYPDAPPRLPGTAQMAFQESDLAAKNVRAFFENRKLETREFKDIGEAVSLGTERGAVQAGAVAFGGPLARQARFAMYTSRLPTWQHRLKVSSSWFFEGVKPQPLGLRK